MKQPSAASHIGGDASANAAISAARGWAQGIADRTFSDPAATVAHFGAVQAQDYAGSLWAIGLRTPGTTESAVAAAIDSGAIVRAWPMRGTLHLVHASDVRWMLQLTAPRALAASRGRMEQLGLTPSVIQRASDLFREALTGGRRCTRGELYAALEAGGISTEGQRGYHLLWRAAHEGVLVSGPLAGKQPTFMLLDDRVPPADALPRDTALARLAIRYFTSHGPATERDLAWWSGLTLTDVRRAIRLAGDAIVPLTLRGTEYWLGSDPSPAEPALATRLLPPFDEFLVGYRDRSAVLAAEHVKRVNAGGGLLDASIILDGHVVGTWKRTRTSRSVVVELRPFTRLIRADLRRIEPAVEEYAGFLGLSPDIVVARPATSTGKRKPPSRPAMKSPTPRSR